MLEHEDNLTERLAAWDFDDADSLARFVVAELRTLARHHARRLGPQSTLQPTAIVNEAFVRLSARQRRAFPSRAHFFALASKVIRDLLVDRLRRKAALKHGGGASHASLADVGDLPIRSAIEPERLLMVHDLLERLKRRDPRGAEVVHLRFFGGLTMREVATVTGRSQATVDRDWQVARRWLVSELNGVTNLRHA